MITGEAAIVYRPVEGGPDEMGEPVVTWQEEVVENCLLSQAYEQNLAIPDGARPEGVDDSATFHVPKTYTASLAGCRVQMCGRMWDVVGDTVGYMPQNTPGAWNRPVKLRGVEG